MRLTTVQDIERAINALTPEQMEELHQWLDRRHPQRIDTQLKADLEANESMSV